MQEQTRITTARLLSGSAMKHQQALRDSLRVAKQQQQQQQQQLPKELQQGTGN
jgi:hypothetical protein